MHNAHQLYWDRTIELMNTIMQPPLAPDLTLRRYTQSRRMPSGIRYLEEPSEMMDLPAGTPVPQLVLKENIRPSRSAKGSELYLVPPDFSPRLYAHRSLSTVNSSGPEIAEHGGAMLQELSVMCQLEWGTDFPKPVSMEKINGEWIIRFRNHGGDRTPSTVGRSNFVTLLICGSNAPSGEFRLPGSLTAQELGDHLAHRFGLMPPAPAVAPCVTSDAGEKRPSRC